jgi:hypothetical protein
MDTVNDDQNMVANVTQQPVITSSSSHIEEDDLEYHDDNDDGVYCLFPLYVFRGYHGKGLQCVDCLLLMHVLSVF